VLCLTTKPDNLLMWAHYASNHSGICIGFDSGLPPFDAAREVKYAEERPSVAVLHQDRPYAEVLEQVLFTKSRHWEYEAEWRCVKRPVRQGELQYYQQILGQDPTLEDEIADLLASEGGAGQYEFAPSALRRIYLGARIGVGMRRRILDLVDKHRVGARLMQMELDSRYFQLNAGRLRVRSGSIADF
jgi:hypothetical protein